MQTLRGVVYHVRSQYVKQDCGEIFVYNLGKNPSGCLQLLTEHLSDRGVREADVRKNIGCRYAFYGVAADIYECVSSRTIIPEDRKSGKHIRKCKPHGKSHAHIARDGKVRKRQGPQSNK